jgi:plasmid stability protein
MPANKEEAQRPASRGEQRRTVCAWRCGNLLALTALQFPEMMVAMSTLTVRNLDDDVKSRLRVRAAQNGRSMEAEAREILKASLSTAPRTGLGTRIHDRFTGLGLDEIDVPGRNELSRAPDFAA